MASSAAPVISRRWNTFSISFLGPHRTPPNSPTVTGDLHTETTLTFTTGGSVSLKGADVQYRFYWDGDDVYSDWLDVGVVSAEHSWDETGTYAVFAEARSASNPETIFSCPSADREITLTFNEVISVPDVTGPTQGAVGEINHYTVVGESSLDHPLEYTVVTWGDGGSVEWTDLDSETNTVELSHAWDSPGTHNVQIHIRCREHKDDAIIWVDFDVEITGVVDEVIAEPELAGPGTGWTGSEYHFTFSGDSNANHQLQYFVDWGNGDTGWIDFPEGRTVELSRVWSEAAEYYTIQAAVRCSDHQDEVEWMDTTIEIVDPPTGAIFADGFESGTTSAW